MYHVTLPIQYFDGLYDDAEFNIFGTVICKIFRFHMIVIFRIIYTMIIVDYAMVLSKRMYYPYQVWTLLEVILKSF